MLLLLAPTGPPVPAHFAHTGWDTFLASLAPLASLALMFLLDPTLVYGSLGKLEIKPGK
jgi:hypothetical protein